MLQEQVSPIKKMNGSKFIVWFIGVAVVVSVLFSYALYQSYLTRPMIKIEDEKK